jgi:serine/threonine kinase 16
MAYRAPELFDVKVRTVLDEKVDIWSLGCVLFALAHLRSPFEDAQVTAHGGSIAMAVMNGKYTHPPGAPYAKQTLELVDKMLVVDPKARPDIHQVGARREDSQAVG